MTNAHQNKSKETDVLGWIQDLARGQIMKSAWSTSIWGLKASLHFYTKRSRKLRI